MNLHVFAQLNVSTTITLIIAVTWHTACHVVVMQGRCIMPKERNYSFGHYNPDDFDQIERDGQTFVIPANIGTSFWGRAARLF